MKVGVIGSGQVAQVLASGFLKHGHEVVIGTRDASKLKAWQQQTKGRVASTEEAAAFGEIVVLSVKGSAAEAVVRALGNCLNGKTVVDTTNPIADAAPVNGVLKFFTSLDESLMERLQKIAPGAHFVKAFSCVGNALMVNPTMQEGTPTMFICGNDEGAKEQTIEILRQFGWDHADMGKVEAARAIEPLCMLWCIPGFVGNSWMHAFKLLKK